MVRLRKFLFFILVIAACSVWYYLFQESRTGLLVHFLDVGQGDSVFIQARNGSQVLIDGGPGNAVLSELQNVMPFYDRSIDMVILTHPDADHLGGLVEVLKRYAVGSVLETGIEHSSALFAEWQNVLRESNATVRYAHVGQTVVIDEDSAMQILAPLKNYKGAALEKTNNTSIVSRLDYGGTSFLFTGDAEEAVEHMLLLGIPETLDADILKVGHHGSKTSTSEEFLRAVSPDIAVISAGSSNRYGHPHKEVLDRLEEEGARVLRTDVDGGVELWSDGKTVWVAQ